MTLFGKLIKRERISKGLTQQKLSEMVDCSTEHLARIEIGSSKPSVKLLETIFQELGIEPFKDIIVSQDPKKHSLISQIIIELDAMTPEQVRLILRLVKVLKTEKLN